MSVLEYHESCEKLIVINFLPSTEITYFTFGSELLTSEEPILVA